MNESEKYYNVIMLLSGEEIETLRGIVTLCEQQTTKQLNEDLDANKKLLSESDRKTLLNWRSVARFVRISLKHPQEHPN